MNGLEKAAILPTVRKLVPRPLKGLLRPLWLWAGKMRYRAKYGFPPLPPGTDLVGYEALIEFMIVRRILSIPGDIVEIGAFCGGGTYKLARLLRRKRLQKKVYAIDCFNIEVDRTRNTAGYVMADLYKSVVKEESQQDIFRRVTKGLDNIVVIPDDSKNVTLPTHSVCFGFIDGNHQPDYVINDFRMVWGKLSPGGVVAFHDYGGDLPEVTTTIDRLCAQYRPEVGDTRVDSENHIIYVGKRKG